MQEVLDLLRLLADGRPRAADECVKAIGGGSLGGDVRAILTDHGVEIGATQWRIPSGLQLLAADEIASRMQSSALRTRLTIDVEWTLDSSNTRLLQRAALHSVAGQVLVAEHQSAGRGRRGRVWMSPVACNLYVSLGFEFARVEELQCLSLAVGVALIEAIQSMGVVGVGLKWPNDLVHEGRKLAGILIESAASARKGVVAVVGMGVNVRVPRYVALTIDQPFTDLTTLAAKPIDRNQLCAAVIEGVHREVDRLRAHGRAQLLERYRHYDVLLDRDIHIKVGDRVVEGVARGIDVQGELLVEVDGNTRTFTAGEVSVRART